MTVGDTVVSTSSKSYVAEFVEEPNAGELEGDTSHISVLAENGDAVAVTTSIGSLWV